MKQAPDHLDFLDSLRGFAILAVAVYHVLGVAIGFDALQFKWDGWIRAFEFPASYLALLPLSFGFLGVSVFFVVSGFCIHLSHAKSGETGFTVFCARRFFRIYPPYLVCLCLFSFVYPWQTVDWHRLYGLAQFGSHAALVHNLSDRSFYAINPAFWSIAVEVQLYLLYPLLWFHARRHGWTRTLVLTAIIELAIRTAGTGYSLWVDGTAPRWATGNPFAFWFSWCLGAWLADAYLARRLPAFPRGALPVLSALTFAAHFWKPTAALVFPLSALASTALILSLLQRSFARTDRPAAGWLSRQLSQLGLISYSYYLLHWPLLETTRNLIRHFSPGPHHPLVMIAWGLAALVPIYLLAVACYRWVELPSIALGKRFIRKLKATRAGEPPAGGPPLRAPASA